MSIFKKIIDFFSNKSIPDPQENNSSTTSKSTDNGTISKYTFDKWSDEEDEQILQEIKELKAKNEAWSKDFNKIAEYRSEGKQLEKEDRKEEALNLYLTSLKFSEQSEYLKYGNYYADIHRVIILLTKLKRTEELKDFLEYIIAKYGADEDWNIRLSKLTKKPRNKTNILRQEDVIVLKAESPTIWEKINNLKSKLPEFNFYYDLPEGENTISYQNNASFEYFQELREYRDVFEGYINEAKLAETEGDLKKAIEIYERLILEKCEKSDPYDRLIVIYSKLKWTDKEIDTLQRAITFFEQLKANQLEYIKSLATKYGMMNKAEEYISQDKKIFYYLGAFELYNPQTTRLQKWNLRLNKLKSR